MSASTGNEEVISRQQSVSSVSCTPNSVLIRNTQPMETGGRLGGKRKNVWLNVEAVGDGSKGCKCKCGHQFGFGMFKKVDRVEKHLLSCSGVSEEEQVNVRKNMSKKRMKQCNVTDMLLPKMDDNHKKKFLLSISEWFYTEAIAFRKIESLYNTLKLLRPDVPTITRRELARKYLDLVTKKYKDLEKDALSQETRICLTTDAWTDVNSESVVNHMFILPSGRALFRNAVYSGSQGHDGEWLAADISKLIEDTREEYRDYLISGVCTDNCAANKAAWHILERKYPKMFFYGCICHGIHLMVKEIYKKLDWFKEICDQSKVVVKFFRASNKESAKLKENGAEVTLKMPGDTRWCSWETMLQSVRRNEGALHKTVSERDFITRGHGAEQETLRREVRRIVQADSWVETIDICIKLLNLFSKYLIKFQSDSVPLSEVYEMFNILPKELENFWQPFGAVLNGAAEVKKIVDDRWEFMYADAHGLAYTLDPRYCGENIAKEDMMSVKDYMHELNPKIEEGAELERFFEHCEMERRRANSTINNINNKEKGSCCISVYTWWKSKRSNEFPGLRELALQVFSLTPSSSASERNFSTFSYIHSKLRNRLTNSTVEKLVYIFVNSKALNTAQSAMETNYDDDDFEEVINCATVPKASSSAFKTHK